MRVIDAHLHVWDLEAAHYDWPTADEPQLFRPIALDEVLPDLASAGIDGVVLVQAGDTVGDTENMLRTADRHPEVLGVVGWVPLDDPAATAAALAARDPRIVGIRALIHTHPDPDFLSRVDDGLAAVAEAGLPFDVVTADPGPLRMLPGLAERHPRLGLVLDHLGKPPIGGTAAAFADWRALLADAAAVPTLSAKVSGLYAAVGPLDSWTPEGIRPFVDAAIELFGPDRLLYGGDWPVSLLAGGYRRSWDAIAAALAPLSAEDRATVLGGTAARVYRLPSAPDHPQHTGGTP